MVCPSKGLIRCCVHEPRVYVPVGGVGLCRLSLNVLN